MGRSKAPTSHKLWHGTNSKSPGKLDEVETGMPKQQLGRPGQNRGNSAQPAKHPPLPEVPDAVSLRIASYNVRVDHHEDTGTVHEWPQRRMLVASTILGLQADIVALQEPSAMQAADLQADLGSEWCVAVTSCDPDAWEAASEQGLAEGPLDGQSRDGNGLAWRRSRLRLMSMCDMALEMPARPAHHM